MDAHSTPRREKPSKKETSKKKYIVLEQVHVYTLTAGIYSITKKKCGITARIRDGGIRGRTRERRWRRTEDGRKRKGKKACYESRTQTYVLR